MIRPVVLSGGSGTRLWPLSTSERPKQFVDLMEGPSLFERTLQRLHGLPDVAAPLVVTGDEHLGAVVEAAREADVGLARVIVEPVGRNTAPAALAAALSLDPDEVMAILPSDHLISDTEAFVDAVRAAAAHAAAGHIVTFGIEPTRPETGYGYIEKGEPLGDAFEVRRFKEKPDEAEAERLIADGRHLWNSGMFVTEAATLLDEARIHCGGVLDGVRSSMIEPSDGLVRLDARFADVEKISLDHAVMEKTRVGVVMPIDVGWDDVGSFEALWSVSAPDAQGNVTQGDVILLDVSGSLVTAKTRRVAVAGIDNVVVVETPDAVLVVPRSRSQLVRDLVRRISGD